MTLNWRSRLSLLATGALVLAAAVHASRRPDYINTPKATLLLLPPTIIAAGDVDEQAWSPDGAYCAVVVRNKTKSWIEAALNPQVDPRHVPLPPAELYVWSRAEGSVKRIWSNEDPHLRIDKMVWIHGTSEFLVSAATARPSTQAGVQPGELNGVCAANAVTGQFRWLSGLDSSAYLTLDASPAKPLVQMMVYDQDPTSKNVSASMCTVEASGEITHRQPVNGPMSFAPTVWSADGTSLLFRDMRKKLILRAQEDGTFAKTSEPIYNAVERNPDLVLTEKPSVTKIRAEHKSLDTLWLSSAIPTDHPDAFVSADGKQSMMAPSLDAVFYVEGGIAKVRTWVPLSDDQKKALMDALKADAVNSAKQVALGLLMFANDNDDMLPGAGGLDSLMPYLKDSSLLDGFNYLPPSNLNSTSWTSPAETIVGMISGPGGNAVAYGDGHVKWQSNP